MRIHSLHVPIAPENRWLYPIDWRQLSHAIRFGRARGRCEQCGRPHLARVAHLGDGRWWDAGAGCWRSGRGRRAAAPGPSLGSVRFTRVVLACAHLDHDPGNNAPANLAALCQRCHMLHDAAEHRWRRWWNAFRARALRDLYDDPAAHRRRPPAPRAGGAWRAPGGRAPVHAPVHAHAHARPDDSKASPRVPPRSGEDLW